MKTKTRAACAVAAGLLAVALTGCGADKGNPDGGPPSDSQASPVHTPGAAVDAEDYVGPPQAVIGKRVDPESKKKTKTTCKTKYTTGSRKGTCKTWNYKEEVDDRDFVLKLSDGTDVDVDEEIYNSYDLTDADIAADVFPRA